MSFLHSKLVPVALIGLPASGSGDEPVEEIDGDDRDNDRSGTTGDKVFLGSGDRARGGLGAEVTILQASDVVHLFDPNASAAPPAAD